jgi:hypothetical protein
MIDKRPTSTSGRDPDLWSASRCLGLLRQAWGKERFGRSFDDTQIVEWSAGRIPHQYGPEKVRPA